MGSITDPRLRETLNLIASDKVEGTNVRRPDGEKIGEIERVMIDKRSGKVAYAVMSFGGFLGIGEDFYPVPWEKLTYNTELDAYELDIDAEQLNAAPHFADEGAFDWSRAEGRRVNDFYGIPYTF
jgi:sporulation protein YlmC with PRC-barrel domain